MRTLNIDTEQITGFIEYIEGRKEIIVTSYSIETVEPLEEAEKTTIQKFLKSKNKKVTINPNANIWE